MTPGPAACDNAGTPEIAPKAAKPIYLSASGRLCTELNT
jgi:hypothetical protein